MKRIINPLALLLSTALLACSCVVFAESLRTQADQSFSRGNYQDALEFYQQAYSANPGDWALQYNMAVCHVKLGNWAQAREDFMALNQQQPDNPLVVYNLAITEKKLGNVDLARDMFFDLSQGSEDESLALLASRQYRQLAGNEVSVGAGPSQWIASIDVSYGVDDNVIDSSTSESTEDKDSFLETLVTARWYQDGAHKKDSWYLEGTGLFSRYQSVSDYDMDLIILGVGKSNATDFGRWLVGMRAETSQLGGEDYLQTLSLNLGLEGDFNHQSGWSVNLRRQDISSQSSDYDYLDGDNYRVDLAYLGKLDNGLRWKLRYRFDDDSRDDLISGSDFYSYSVNRHGLMLQGIYLLDEWMFIGKLEHRISDYKDDHIIDGVEDHRQDSRDQFSLRAERRLSSNWIVSADYSYTSNSSSLSQYDYDRGVLMLGAGLQF
ncbi:hypothetical protein R50073_41940 [Maricurvus nonylphenolicus]|uniref:tetratricopeptide repeat protein n=1 Tax=Maricurvus nonylphenolicus TaxID=1008307 RepID=UPI0036F27742